MVKLRGVFITFEGGDGSGKSTQTGLLIDWLQRMGLQVVTSREPGATDLGQTLRNLVLHQDIHIDPRAEALIYAADRAQNIAEKVRPALEKGYVVVQDRYIDSSVAYQSAGRGLPEPEIRRISNWATSNLKPDLTVLLDLDPRATLDRLARRRYDRLESAGDQFHERVRDMYLGMVAREPDRFEKVDATLSIEAISQIIRTRVQALLDRKGIYGIHR